MILSAFEFVRRRDLDSTTGKLVIDPYNGECQQPASYDLGTASNTALPRGTCTLSSNPRVDQLPADLAGTLRCRSSFGRRGVLLGAGYIDPGFRGHLTLCLSNMGNADIIVKKNDRIVQMILHEVREGNESYSGRYQDSLGIVEAR